MISPADWPLWARSLLWFAEGALFACSAYLIYLRHFKSRP